MKAEREALCRLITQEHKETGASVLSLCKKHGMAVSNYYHHRLKLYGPVKGSQPQPKRKYTKKPKVIDIPLQAAPRDVVIVCNPGALKSVLEQWS